jgi:hypothetical protein
MIQFYKGIKLELIKRNYTGYRAKRFTLNGTNQNVWIPNKHLEPNGKIKENENLDYIFKKAHRQLELAGYNMDLFVYNEVEKMKSNLLA